MAENLKIAVHTKGSEMHIELSGEIDRESIKEVFDLIRKNYEGVSKICIDTSEVHDDRPAELIASEWLSWGHSLLDK